MSGRSLFHSVNKKGDSAMETWCHGSMLTWLRMFGVIVRGVVSRIVVVLIEEATKE